MKEPISLFKEEKKMHTKVLSSKRNKIRVQINLNDYPDIKLDKKDFEKEYKTKRGRPKKKSNVEWVKFIPPHKIRKTPCRKGLRLCQLCQSSEILSINEFYEEINGINKDDGDFLWCFDCGRAFHIHCLYENEVNIVRKLKIFSEIKWRCPDCKYCEKCFEYESDSPTIMCECCDRGYHISCLNPKLNEIPQCEWICPKCINTNDLSINEEVLYIQNDLLKLKCVICNEDKPCKMFICALCNKGVHIECDNNFKIEYLFIYFIEMIVNHIFVKIVN